jgi:hypothetical protein
MKSKLGLLSFILLSTIILASLSSCAGATKNIQKNGDKFILDNGLVHFEINRKIGYIELIKNNTTKITYYNSDKGIPAISLSVGDSKELIELNNETQNKADSVKSYSKDDRDYLEFKYNNLIFEDSKEKTGIELIIYLSLGKKDEYIKTKSSIKIDKDGQKISSIRYCDSEAFTSGLKDEILTAPMWGGGTYWEAPFSNKSFKQGVRLGYPGENDASLESGWADLYTENAGIGIGYINAQKLAMEFSLKMDKGMKFSPVLFDAKIILGKSVPLMQGESFTTDEVIIAPHSGDWHTMADIYREEYNKAFVTKDGKPDYLTVETLSKKVKNTDYMFRFFAGLDGKLVTTYDKMYNDVTNWLKSFNSTTEPLGKNGMIWITGQNEKGYAFDVPIMIPSFPPSGGTDGLKTLDQKLQALGCTVFHYEHPFAVDPDGAGYIKSADPLQHTEFWNLCTHHSVCIDNEAMMNLWKNKIIPDIKSTGADAVQFDQGSIQQTVCDLSGHSHELDAVSRLTSHIKAVTELSIYVRKNLSDESYIVSEGASDLTTRYMDIRQTGWFRKQLYGGKPNRTLRQYIFPQFVSQYDGSLYISEGNMENSMLAGAVSGGIVCISDGAVNEIPKEYIRFRTEIRDAKAPGFPVGFKDTLGLQVSDSKLFARVFTDGKKVTVTYTSGKSEINNATVKVDFKKLGFENGGVKDFQVTLGRNKCGYTVLEP